MRTENEIKIDLIRKSAGKIADYLEKQIEDNDKLLERMRQFNKSQNEKAVSGLKWKSRQKNETTK